MFVKKRHKFVYGDFKYNYYELRRGLEEILDEVQVQVVKSEEDIPMRKKLKALKKAKKLINKAFELFPTDVEVKDYVKLINDRKSHILSAKKRKMQKRIIDDSRKLKKRAFQKHVAKSLQEIKDLQKRYPHKDIWKDFYWDVASLLIFEEITSTNFDELSQTIKTKAS
jgi:hypothetical protein